MVKLYLTKEDMKAYMGVEVKLYVFLTSAVHRDTATDKLRAPAPELVPTMCRGENIFRCRKSKLIPPVRSYCFTDSLMQAQIAGMYITEGK
jgi:hypothetical protein